MKKRLLVAFAATFAFSAAAYAQAPGVNPVHDACHVDVEKVCPTATPGAEGAQKCIKENYDKMSDGCKDAIAKMRAANAPKSAAPAAPAPQ